MRKFILITLLCALVVFGCDDGNNNDTHTHEWGAWQYNATEHWKECSCGEEYGRANHTGDPCTICGYETPKPHESTITAFGKTATVIGDASIPKADFDAAVTKLQDTLSEFDGAFSNLGTSEKTQLTNIMTRGITIVPSNAVPASVGGALTVGVDYLKSKGMDVIADDLFSLMDSNAFAMLKVGSAKVAQSSAR